MEVNCAEACVNGCILGDKCPHQTYKAEASSFIQEKSLDEMLAIAEEARRKKMFAPPQWVVPEELESDR